MNLLPKICVGLLLMPAASLCAQVDITSTQAPDSPTTNPDTDSRMTTPPPVSAQAYPASYPGGEKSNYLRGGVAFSSAYSDNELGSIAGKPISDVSYSVGPFIALDETTSRLHWGLTY